MVDFQEAVKIAGEWDHKSPPWLESPPAPPGNLPGTTQRMIDVFFMSKRPDGEMGGIEWWQCANAYTAVALRDLWSGDHRNYELLSKSLRSIESRRPGFINEFNDDTLWWAMCCIHMHAISGDGWFLDKAKGVWQHIRAKSSVCGRGQVFFQDRDMEGACYWTTRPGEDQINAISSGLYAELSVRLALAQGSRAEKHPHLSKLLSMGKEPSREDYLCAARCSLGWILRCRYRPRDGVVLDQIRLKKNEAVDWTFSYTTGVALGVCALMYEATREAEYMTLAIHMGHRAMRNGGWVEGNGVLTEHGCYGHGRNDPGKNNDAVGFKAVLMRQLAVLYDVIVRTAPPSEEARQKAGMIRAFVNVNFLSQQERNTNGNGQYGPWWNGPFEKPTSHSQHAVLDVMAAVMLVTR